MLLIMLLQDISCINLKSFELSFKPVKKTQN